MKAILGASPMDLMRAGWVDQFIPSITAMIRTQFREDSKDVVGEPILSRMETARCFRPD